MNGCERVLATFAGEPADCLPLMPITMMFAGDYIGRKYGEYTQDYRVLVEGQLAVAEAFGFDYVSCISDPAREAADCGAAIAFFDDQPPAVKEGQALLADKTRLAALDPPAPAEGRRMADRLAAADAFKERAGGALLIEGWIEGPCAEAADLRGINTLMLDFYDDPGFVRDLFAFAVELGITFAQAQIAAGCDIIGVGDAAASLVGPTIYNEFVWPYEKQLVDGIHAAGGRVRLHICGDTRPILAEMGQLECAMIDLDFMVPVADARAAMGPRQVLAGNLDPVKCVRNGSPERILAELDTCRNAAAPGYIVGAGCEIVRDTPHENLRAMTRYAKEHTPGTIQGG